MQNRKMKLYRQNVGAKSLTPSRSCVRGQGEWSGKCRKALNEGDFITKSEPKAELPPPMREKAGNEW